IKYDAGVVTPEQAERYAERVERILTAFAETPDLPVSRIDLRTSGASARLNGRASSSAAMLSRSSVSTTVS
ncbi:hypothetical protein PXH80_33790, partial [Mycolicibacterium smegmatis]|uniref:hypothetical protein n=1 Tax=Mycolicibacterium smegmatis TaxID=1772 RepID=UPI0023DB3FFC